MYAKRNFSIEKFFLKNQDIDLKVLRQPNFLKYQIFDYG